MVELAKYENENEYYNNKHNNSRNRNNSYNKKHYKNHKKHFFNYNSFVFSIIQYNTKNNRFFCSPSHKAVRRLRYLFNLNCKKKTR